jgi:hypothetical protein
MWEIAQEDFTECYKAISSFVQASFMCFWFKLFEEYVPLPHLNCFSPNFSMVKQYRAAIPNRCAAAPHCAVKFQKCAMKFRNQTVFLIVKSNICRQKMMLSVARKCKKFWEELTRLLSLHIVISSRVLFHNGSLLHSEFNTQLLITVHNSSTILTHV